MISSKLNFNFATEFIGSHMFGGMGRKLFPSAGKIVEDGYLIHVGPAVDPGDCPAMISQVSASNTVCQLPDIGGHWAWVFLDIVA
jgi:hypothetical protein